MTFARALFVVGLVACKKYTPTATPTDGPDGLRAAFVSARAACEAKDFAKGRAIVVAMMPTKDAIAKVLVDTAPPTLVDQIADQGKEVPALDEKAACLLSPPGRTNILVHRATTEELVAYADGTLAAKEFPNGAQALAKVLRPQTAFYEVETVEPGKDRGTKFHMFFWDGGAWRMLGPAWRYLDGAEQEH